MASIEEARKRIEEASAMIDAEVAEIIAALEGIRVVDIKRFLSSEKYEFNTTKRKLIEILDIELSSKINQQELRIKKPNEEEKKMKKIQLSDGMPNDVSRQEVTRGVKSLTDKIKELCKESELSYVQINKALYLSDKELYMEKISN